MNPLTISVLCGATMLGSWALTRVVRSYALVRGVLDVPNERSSHAVPTPRGGGTAIVLATVSALCILALADALPWYVVVGFAGPGGIVAGAGLLDDLRHLRWRWRLLAHFGAAYTLLISMGGIRPITTFGDAVSGWLIWPIALLYIVWLINLTNFMDGIDGLAASEAVTVSAGGALLYAIAAPTADGWRVALVFAAAAGGFLIWNRPPASIFMGDVGSGFLGFSLAAMSLYARLVSPQMFWGWIVLLGVFVVDASMVLIRRILRGDQVFDAHRTHAYQHAAARWRTHGGVTLVVVALNLFWLLPLACLVALHRLEVVTGVVIAYAPLVIAAVWLGAGAPALTGQTRSARSTGENVGR
jgi:glycosyltransferase WbpL